MFSDSFSTGRLKSFAIDLWAGGVSGVISKSISAPIERVKLILQVQNSNPRIVESQRYTGTINCAIRIYKEEGFLKLWRGNLSSVIRYFPTQALNFAFKDSFKAFFVGKATKISDFNRFFIGNLLSGGTAGAVSLVIVYPLDYTRTRLGADVSRGSSHQFSGILDCLKKTVQTDGIKGVYQGLSVAFVGVVLFRALHMGGYDVLKSIWLEDDSNSKSNLITNPSHWLKRWILAQFVTIVTGTLVYPIDTVRRRLMMESGLDASEKRFTDQKTGKSSVMRCVRDIYKREGVRGFLFGIEANVLRSISGSLMLVLYDDIKNIS